MSRKRRIGVALLLVFFCFIWWRVIFYNQKSGFEEMAIEDGATSFTAAFDTVNYIVVSNNDEGLGTSVNNAEVKITITGQDGNTIVNTVSTLPEIHTNAYTSAEGCSFTELPVHLKSGSVYHVNYQARLSDGTELKNLSFLFYGNTDKTNRQSAAVFGIIAALILICLMADQISNRRYMVIWGLLFALSLLLMPLLQSQDENTAFADVYGYSSELLGKKVCDQNRYAYIDESGIRNNGYLSYSVPLNRFWTDLNYGNNIAADKVSILYKMSGEHISIVQLPSLAGITLVRVMHLPYQFVLASGWVINGLVTLLLLLISMLISEKNKENRSFLMLLGSIPSFLIASMSYTGTGMALSLALLYWTICRKTDLINIRKRNVLAFILLVVLISVNYAYCVLGLLLFKLTGNRKENMVYKTGIIFETLVLFAVRQYELVSYGAGGSLLQSSPADYIGAVLNTIFVRTDSIINEMVAYHYYSHEEMVIVIYLTLAAIVLSKAWMTECGGKTAAADSLCGINTLSLTAWAAGIILLMTYGCYSVNEATGIYGIFDNFTGEQLLPFVLLPEIWKFKGSVHNDYMQKLISAVIACTVVIFLIRLGKV